MCDWAWVQDAEVPGPPGERLDGITGPHENKPTERGPMSSSTFYTIIIQGKLLQQVRTRKILGLMAHKSTLTKHQGKIQHVSPDELENGDRIQKKKSLLMGGGKGSWILKCIKA